MRGEKGKYYMNIGKRAGPWGALGEAICHKEGSAIPVKSWSSRISSWQGKRWQPEILHRATLPDLALLPLPSSG